MRTGWAELPDLGTARRPATRRTPRSARSPASSIFAAPPTISADQVRVVIEQGW